MVECEQNRCDFIDLGSMYTHCNEVILPSGNDGNPGPSECLNKSHSSIVERRQRGSCSKKVWIDRFVG